MKKLFIVIILVFTANTGYSQITPYYKSSWATYTPLTAQEIMLAAQLREQRNIENQRINRENQRRFTYYQNLAYESLNKDNYYDFLDYSNYALQTGWYNSKLYYDRGRVFEEIGYYKEAKMEYKKAMKRGYSRAKSALKNLRKNKRHMR